MSESQGRAKRTPMDLALARVPHGRVHVIAERCKQCDFCVNYCPADVLSYSDEINAKGYHFPQVSVGKEDACIHCKFCDLICPELAIFTSEAEDIDAGAAHG